MSSKDATNEGVSTDYDRADIALALRILSPGDDVTLGELRRGVPHDHTEYVEGCFRCDLSSDETRVTAPEGGTP